MRLRDVYIPTYPLQIVEEVSPNLEMVYVIPVRNWTDTKKMEDFLPQLVSEGSSTEIILVVHSFEFDTDDVRQANLDFYWSMEKKKQELQKNGLAVHLVNYVGLDQVYERSLLPFFVGMEEALQRLRDAGNLNGVISLLTGSEELSHNFTDSLLKHFKYHPDLAAAEGELEFGLDEEAMDPAIFEALVNTELQWRLHRYLLDRSGYPSVISEWPFLFNIRARVFQQLNRKTLPVNVQLSRIYHIARQNGGATACLTDVRVSPDIGSFPHAEWLKDWKIREDKQQTMTFDLWCYHYLEALLNAVPGFYSARNWNDYQETIRSLPPPAIAFLSDESFVEIWQELKNRATNFERFRQLFHHWLSPERTIRLLQFSASHFQQSAPLSKVASLALRKYLGVRSTILDNEQMLYYFRRYDKGLQAEALNRA